MRISRRALAGSSRLERVKVKKKKGIWGGCGRYLMLFPDQRDGLADCEMDACNETILFTFSCSDFSIRHKHVNE